MKANMFNKTNDFARDEAGSATIMGSFFLLTSAVILGLAVDHANGWRIKTKMQIATDAAALAAAAHLDDEVAARKIGLQVANMNLSTDNAVVESDIHLGSIDPDTLQFVSNVNADGKYDAVQVKAARNAERNNELPTFLMKLAGVNYFNVSASATALARRGGNGGGFAGCEDAVFLTSNRVETGGGNRLTGAVCIHGEQGLRTGGNDYYTDEVRLSAPTLEQIDINTPAEDSPNKDRLEVARTMSPVILPQLNSMHNEIWNELWNSEDDIYEGNLMPSFVKAANGRANIVRKSGWWAIQPGDLEENTIYLVDGSAQFSGGVDIQNIAIIAKQGIGVGGGFNLKFNNILFMGKDLNLAGNVTWGTGGDACSSNRFGVYLFGLNSLSMGGWGSAVKVDGVVGAAPRFSPGGQMTGSGIYFESAQQMDLGGKMNITGCGESRTSEYTLAEMSTPIVAGVTGSYLAR